MRMARILCCWMCRVELEPIQLADGSSAVVCVGCDLIGLTEEVAVGGPLIPAEALKRRPRDPCGDLPSSVPRFRN
jgi:hypothetical protein